MIHDCCANVRVRSFSVLVFLSSDTEFQVQHRLNSLWDKQQNISMLATGVKLCKLFTRSLWNVKTPGDTLPEVSAPLWSASK